MIRSLMTIPLQLVFSFMSTFAQSSVAVMNFKNTGDALLDYLSAGMADMLTTSLFESREITVVERSQLARLISEMETT